MIRFERAFHFVPPCSSYKEKGIKYKMSNSGKLWRLTLFILLLISTTALLPSIYSSTLTLDTDQEAYYQGDLVTINGTGPPETEIQLIVNNSETILNTTLNTDIEGKYNYTLQLEVDVTEGNYTINAQANTYTVKTQIQINKTECHLYHILKTITQETKIRLIHRIEKLSEQGKSVEAFQEKLEEGDILYQEADELFLQGNCHEATQKMNHALNQYGDGYTESQDPIGNETELERIQELKNRIKRSYILLNRLNKTSQQLEEKGYDTNEIQNNLYNAKTNLTEAEETIEDIENIALNEEKIELAEEILDQVQDALKEITRERRRDQAKIFIKDTKERLKQLEKSLKEILKNKTNSEEIEKIEKIFNQTIEYLEDIIENLNQGEIDNSLDDLSETLQNNENEVENIDLDKEELKRLKVIQKLLEKIHDLREEVSSLPDSSDISHIEDLLDEAEIILQEAKNRISDMESENLIKEADEIVEEAEETLEEFDEDDRENESEEELKEENVKDDEEEIDKEDVNEQEYNEKEKKNDDDDKEKDEKEDKDEDEDEEDDPDTEIDLEEKFNHKEKDKNKTKENKN